MDYADSAGGYMRWQRYRKEIYGEKMLDILPCHWKAYKKNFTISALCHKIKVKDLRSAAAGPGQLPREGESK